MGQHRTCDHPAFQELLPIVHRVARRLLANGPRCDHEDLVQAGTLGLLDTLERHGANEALEGLAVCRIQGAMLDYLRSQDPLTRRQRQRVKLVTAAREKLERAGAIEPSDAEVAKDTGLSERECADANLDAIASKSVGVHESLTNSSYPDPSELFEQRESMGKLTAAINRLDVRLRELIQRRYFDGREMSEIAETFHVTPSRVSQLHRQALERLKDYVEDPTRPSVRPARVSQLPLPPTDRARERPSIAA